VYESIQGQVVLREPTRCVVEAAGLGYEIHISLRTYEHLPRAGEAARLLLHPIVRDDAWRLFGFSEEDERTVFRDLLRVNGVGPLVALSLLSGFRPDELASAVSTGDARILTRVKGVGKKTAERILVELKDRWKDGTLERGPAGTAGDSGPSGRDAVRALEALGLDALEARRRVERLLKDAPDAPIEDLVRRALRQN